MRRFWTAPLLAPLLAGLFIAGHAQPATAQLRIVQPGPDCRLARTAIDQPFYGVSWKQRRWTWHLEFFALANLVAEGIHRLPPNGVTPWKSAVAAQVLTADVPHAIGLLKHEYPLDPADVFLADPVIRSAPFLWEHEHTDGPHRWRDHLVALGEFAVMYAVVSCFASP